MTHEQQRFRTLSDALRAVAAEETALSASPAVESRLLGEVRSIARMRRRRIAMTWTAAAATLAVVVAVPAWRSSRAPAAPRPPATAVEVTTPCLALPYSSVPISGGQLVRLEVPRAALVSFGLAPIEPADTGVSATVLADVLVGDDGLARAVRFVQP